MQRPSTHPTPPRTGFMVLHSNRMEGLRDLLVDHIRHNPLPPLAAETVLVQSNGMKHWLGMALAQDDALGICAATRMVLPSSQLWQIYRTVLGAERLPMHMPLDKAPLAWRILRKLPQWLDDPRYAVLSHYMGEDRHGIRAYHLAQQLADVFDGYQNYRSDWLNQWAQGVDQWERAEALPAPHAWQAAMWRDLLQDVQQHAPWSGHFESRADVHQAFLNTLNQHTPGSLSGLPPRLMVFGVTALPMQTMQALVALGRHLPVLMFVHNPCQEHWGHLSEDLSQGGHPLLAAWGKQGRDYLHAIDQFEAADEYAPTYQRVSVFINPKQDCQDEGLTPGVLHQLQTDILHLSPPPDTPVALDRNDDSVVFVQAHSAQREVEVLHDRVLGWLNADPQLQPSDIMVMVPDMALFAPHIHAVFGRYASGSSPELDVPYSVTDSTPRTHALVQAMDTLLQLPQLRMSLRDWAGLFQVKAVRDRYALSQADVEQLHRWLSDAGVRWGLDAEQRQPWGISAELPDADQNTWGFGLRRLLLGYALGPQANPLPWQDVAAHAAIDGLDAPLVNGLLRWLNDMDRSLIELKEPQHVADWLSVWQQLSERFFCVTDDADQRVLDQLFAPLEDTCRDCQLAGFDTPLPLGVLRSHWLAQLDSIGLQQRFAAGGVQFATLMPMRAIPFKIVCLLGMNDNAYPRSPTPRDFDLISQPGQARAGDRARREDDRYLFLEAVLSARQRLYVSWQGKRASDHAPLPASVLVAQLLDHLNRCVCLAEPLTTQPAFTPQLQPLQPFSRRYFTQGSGFATYAAEWASVHGQRSPASPENAVNSESALADGLDASALLALLRQPVEVYFKHHLQVQLDTPQDTDEENEPFDLGGLDGYLLKQQVIDAPEPLPLLQQLKLRGELAMAAGGQAQQAALLSLKADINARLEPWLQQASSDWPAQSLTMKWHGINVSLTYGGEPARWRLRTDGSGLQIDMRAGKVLHGHALYHLWLGHLSANAAGIATESVQSGEDGVITLKALPAAQALAWLEALVLLYREAWNAPLHVARKSACDLWLQQQKTATGKLSEEAQRLKALGAARLIFDGGHRRRGEHSTSPYLQRAFSRFDDMDLHLFEALADQLYGPMLQTSDLQTKQDAEDDT